MIRAIVVLLLLVPPSLEAAVVARFVEWTEILDTPPFDFVNNIDLDGDGNRDFYTSTRQSMATLIPEGNNRVLAIDERPPDLGWTILPLTRGDPIADDSIVPGNWRGLADRPNDTHLGGAVIYQCLNFCVSFIEAPDVVNYVGVELEREGEVHYGWVALGTPHMSGRHIMQVYGWGYETVPGVPIAAGAVPEPGGGLLVVVGGLIVLLHRRRA